MYERSGQGIRQRVWFIGHTTKLLWTDRHATLFGVWTIGQDYIVCWRALRGSAPRFLYV